MLQTDDMIHFASEVGVFFVNEAVFAKVLGTRGNQPPKVIADVVTHW